MLPAFKKWTKANRNGHIPRAADSEGASLGTDGSSEAHSIQSLEHPTRVETIPPDDLADVFLDAEGDDFDEDGESDDEDFSESVAGDPAFSAVDFNGTPLETRKVKGNEQFLFAEPCPRDDLRTVSQPQDIAWKDLPPLYYYNDSLDKVTVIHMIVTSAVIEQPVNLVS